MHVCSGKAGGVVRILKCSVVLYKNKTRVIFPLFVITSNTTSCNQHQWCLCVCPHVRAPSFVCVSMQEYLIHPVSQSAVSFRMELHKRLMEIPGELLSCGLAAPSGMHYLGILSLYSQSVCERA